jgi:DNA-binding transcriptional regulator GbsR (MarR family)
MTPRDSTADLKPVVRRFIEEGGKTTQALGLGRVLGQIYAFLYFSPVPRNLGDMQWALGISKASASTGVRQLEQWEAVRQVWVRGDRKDYYEANDWFGRILKKAVLDTIGKRLSSYAAVLEDVARTMASEGGGGAEEEFIRERVEHAKSFQGRAQRLWNNPLLQRILK